MTPSSRPSAAQPKTPLLNWGALPTRNKRPARRPSPALLNSIHYHSITATMDRDSLVYKAKLAEQAERFDEMVSDMKDVAKQPQ
ncbi:hypothetical protein THAOC_36310, partial [Thalassiosira oceanica]